MARIERSILCATIAGLVALSGMPAMAGEAPVAESEAAEPSASELSDRAVAEFEAGNYDAAIELFERAHAKDPQPNYLYNIARVYEEKGDFAAAVERYQAFIAEPRVDLGARENAIERLKVLRAALEQLREEPAVEAEPEPPPPRATERQWTDEQPAMDAGPSERVKKVRIAGYSLMGVGGAALVVGGVFGGLALGKKKDAEGAEFVDDAMGMREEARTQARVADAMLATGGVLVGVGLIAVLATLGKKNRGARSQTAWVPTAGRDGFGLGVTHRF